MSNAAAIVDSQNSGRSKFKGKGDVIVGSTLQQPKSASIPHSFALKRREIAPVGTPAFGSVSTYTLPPVNFLSELAIRVDLTNPSSGDYTTYAGSRYIDTVEIYSGTNLI